MNEHVAPDTWLKAIAKKVVADGPQTVDVEGYPQLTVIAESEYRTLRERKKTFKEWLLTGPRLDDLDLERDPRPGRDFSF